MSSHWFRNYNKKRFYFLILLFVIQLSSLFCPCNVQSQIFGNVIVVNETQETVEVLVQNYDFMGRPRWDPIGMVYSQANFVFPNVPQGKLFGARTLSRNREWPPSRIFYPLPSPYMPIPTFTITYR